jgi:hypothetical protein
MMALVIGALFAAGALVFVLWPLVARDGSARVRGGAGPAEPAQDGAIRALREIEFDRATGKLSPADYEQLKGAYTSRAVAELRAHDEPAAPVRGDDAAEALIRRARATAAECWHCRTVCPEPDAVYCSTCGAYLAGQCTQCHAPIRESGARFCASCGWTLAA